MAATPTVKIHFVLDQCKFYPIHRRGVFAGTISKLEVGSDDNANFGKVHPGDRCLVYYAEDDANSAIGGSNKFKGMPSPLPTIDSLMQQWSANETGNSKCTKWIRLVVPQPVCCHFLADAVLPTQKIMKHRKSWGNGIDNTASKIADSASPKHCWIFEKCIHVSADGRIEHDNFTLPSTFDLKFALEQTKFYSTKHMVLDGTVVEAKPSFENSLLPDLIKGERCHVHLRYNIKSLLQELQGGDETFVNPECDATGWIQFTTSLLVTCRVLILPSYVKSNENVTTIDVPRNAKKEGTVMLECQEVLDIRQNTMNIPAANAVRRLNNRSVKTGGTIRGNEGNDNSHPLPALHDRADRHRIFAKWLVDKFGVDFLSQGSGVLDVAGGKGELCKALLDLGVKNATLLDPDARCDPKAVPFQVIGEALKGDASGLTGENRDESDEESNRISELIQRCSLIAGMHPDGATEAIVDTSLRLGVPFAILPCCYSRKIFAKPPLNATKHNVSGTNKILEPHQSYNIFCQYLLEKAPVGIRFQTENLPFQGRNKLIYFETFLCQVASTY